MIDKFLGIQSKYEKVYFKRLYDFDSSYATHNLYPYPAKFIPHVVRFFLEKYTKPGQWVFDPFAGSGTVGIEAELTGRNYILWDINPMLDIIAKASTWKGDLKLPEVDFDYEKRFIPRWENLFYWHPKEFVDQLSRLWGFYHDNPNPLLAIPLMKVTKYFSYAELEFPKLYKSRKAVERVQGLLSGNWREKMRDMLRAETERVLKKVEEFQRLAKGSNGIVKAGVNSLSEPIPEVDAIITSPPYLQAQEYIRTFKIELYWLGYDPKKYSSYEIPYNKEVRPIEVKSETFIKYRQIVEGFNHEGLMRIYDTYFFSILSFFEKVKAKTIGVFVGPVKIRNVRIPIDEIIKEHLESKGFIHEKTYIDTILSRKIKEVKYNPATGLIDERTPTEHLLILSRP